MAFFYECSAVTHIGTRRKNHEDNFYIGEMLTSLEQASLSQTGPRSVRKSIAADNGRNRIFAVSDGMGGHKHYGIFPMQIRQKRSAGGRINMRTYKASRI